MQNGTNYIAVTAYDSIGSSTTLYDAFFIRKDTAPPPAPVLSNPLNTSSTGTVNVGFSWQVSNDGVGSGTTNYTIVVATSPDFGHVIFTSTTLNTYVTSTVLNQNLYYWQVRAYDYAGNTGPWSSIWSVAVDTTPPPAVSSLTAPLNNLTTNQITLNFSWAGVTDSPAGIANYILEASTSPTFSGVIYSSWVAGNSATLTLNQSSYTWRVNTMDNALNYTTSTAVYFVTVDTTPPPVVATLNTPLNNLTTNQMTLNFTWATVSDSPAGLANYILQVSTDPAFGVINYSSWVVTNSATLNLITSSYTWRVNTIDNALNYTTSTVNYFVTIDTSPPPAVSNLTAPLNNLTTNQMTLNFSWTAVSAPPSGIKNYILEVSTDPAFGVINYSSWVVLNQASLTLNQSSYTWRVNAMDNALNYTTSTAVYFVTVDTTAPSAVSTLGPPSNNQATNLSPVIFNWAAVTDIPAGIKNYIVEVSTSANFVPIRYSSWVATNSASIAVIQSSYSWRVNAMDNALNYTTSTVVYSVVFDTTPPNPVTGLTAPLNNLTTNQMTLTFQWTAVTSTADIAGSV